MTAKLAILFLALRVLTAASPAPQDGQLSLGGTVINSITDQPVPRALVQILRFMPQEPAVPGQRPVPTPPFVARTLTDAGGGFRFTGLAPGDYSVSVQKPQFEAADDEGLPNTVALTASTSAIKLRLSPLAVITEKVVDQDGEPLWAASVVAVSTQIVDGLRQTKQDRTVATDERGMYRLWNLQPGRYFLKAAGRSATTYLYTGDSTPQFFSDQSFAPAYHGGGRTLDSATPLEIRAGNEIHADLTVKIEPAHSIRGALANFVPHRAVRFELLSAGESLPASPVSVNADTGRFDIQGVITGEYILHTTQDETSADVAVNMMGADLNGVSLALVPGVDLKVITSVANPAANNASDGSALGPFAGTSCMVTLHPIDGRSSQPSVRSRASVIGEVTIHFVAAGLYRAVASCYGGYARSIMWGTQDLLANPVLSVTAGSEPEPIQIVAVRGGGTITGRLAVETPAKVGSVAVLIVPQFAGSTGPIEEPVVASKEDGSGLLFQFGNLAPGTYRAYAFAGRNDLEFRNPKFLQSLTGGVSIQVDDNSEKTITLTEVVR